MEQEEKELINKLKDFDMSNLYGKGSYIDFLFQNCWTQGYIKKLRPNNKYDVILMLGQGQIKILSDVTNKLFSFFGEYSHLHGFEQRGICFNQELYCMQPKQVIHLFNIKLKKLNIILNNETKNKKKKKQKKKKMILNRIMNKISKIKKI